MGDRFDTRSSGIGLPLGRETVCPCGKTRFGALDGSELFTQIVGQTLVKLVLVQLDTADQHWRSDAESQGALPVTSIALAPRGCQLAGQAPAGSSLHHHLEYLRTYVPWRGRWVWEW